ncbi:hypothetical protein B0H65DRAFT_547120 [Neurospora tetraspora]|uniref:Uncharacterized protein n=1 Tax=Neurospora tetraspora TaxID=94610 RepID=A0AAE0MV34_9PEZI|nr:hypothetical protein B0H65DRAFT_547120 [Neurospora tetraspora]
MTWKSPPEASDEERLLHQTDEDNSSFRDPPRPPADDVISCETVVFHSGLHLDRTEYQGPSDEVKANWEALYNSKRLPLPTPPTVLPSDRV